MLEFHRHVELLPFSTIERMVHDLLDNIDDGRAARGLTVLLKALIQGRYNNAIQMRMMLALEDSCFMSNLGFCLTSLLQQEEITERHDEFLVAAFDLLREMMVLSGPVQSKLVRARTLDQCVLPLCWIIGYSQEARASLVGALTKLYDHERGTVFKSHQLGLLKDTTKSIMAAVYGERLDVHKIYSQGERRAERGGESDPGERAKLIVKYFAEQCWDDLMKRAHDLVKWEEASAYVRARSEASKDNTMRKMLLPIIICDDKISKQSETEASLSCLAHMIAKTEKNNGTDKTDEPPAKRARYCNGTEETCPPRDRKVQGLLGIAFGSFVARRIFKFASQNFSIRA